LQVQNTEKDPSDNGDYYTAAGIVCSLLVPIGQPRDGELYDGCDKVGTNSVQIGGDGVLCQALCDGLLNVSLASFLVGSRVIGLTGRKFELLATPTPYKRAIKANVQVCHILSCVTASNQRKLLS
jgi:hypothetical protein